MSILSNIFQDAPQDPNAPGNDDAQVPDEGAESTVPDDGADPSLGQPVEPPAFDPASGDLA